MVNQIFYQNSLPLSAFASGTLFNKKRLQTSFFCFTLILMGRVSVVFNPLPRRFPENKKPRRVRGLKHADFSPGLPAVAHGNGDIRVNHIADIIFSFLFFFSDFCIRICSWNSINYVANPL